MRHHLVHRKCRGWHHAWKDIDHSSFLGRSPDGCLRRLIKVLCIAGKVFISYVNNVDPEGRLQSGRDVFFSLLVGMFAWLLLFDLLPVRGWLIAAVGIPVVALFALTNELPIVDWDNRVRQWIVQGLVYVATTRLLVSVMWLLLEGTGLVTLETQIRLSAALRSGVILAMMRLPVRIQATLMEGKLLFTQISRFLNSDLRIPTYVTVAQEIPPNSPYFALPGPGVFNARYEQLHLLTADLRTRYAFASAALPYGIFPQVEIDKKIYIDGGVADNTPVLPMADEGVDEVWIICLQPEPLDLQEHLRNIRIQAIIAKGPAMMRQSFDRQDKWLKKVQFVTLAPCVSLGSLLTGTLNFNKRRTEACIRHGYRVAKRALRNPAAGPQKPRQLKFGWLTWWLLLRRAFPPCRIWRLFARSDANREALRDFKMPPGVHPPPPVKDMIPAWDWSVGIVWALFMTDAFARQHPWNRVVLGTLVGCVVMLFPRWWRVGDR